MMALLFLITQTGRRHQIEKSDKKQFCFRQKNAKKRQNEATDSTSSRYNKRRQNKQQQQKFQPLLMKNTSRSRESFPILSMSVNSIVVYYCVFNLDILCFVFFSPLGHRTEGWGYIRVRLIKKFVRKFWASIFGWILDGHHRSRQKAILL